MASISSTISYTLAPSDDVLYLTGTDSINGNGNYNANIVYGNAGNNIINGLQGADTVYGGAGNDTIYANMPGSLSATWQDVLYGGTGDDALYADGFDRLYGEDGNDSLYDGNTTSNQLYGGLGNDAYYLNNVSSVVNEQAGQGVDTVYSMVSVALDNSLAGAPLISGEVENLTLTNGPVNLKGGGNALNNLITGNVSANTLWGSVGADTLQGGGGNDVLYGNSATVLADAAQDWLYGGDGDDTLYADGNDMLLGGVGADTYIIRAGLANTIIEDLTPSAVVDTVKSEISFSLGLSVPVAGMPTTQVASGAVERLELQGSADLIGLGSNGVNNTLQGNSGNNVLMGGTGMDILYGGAGNDTLYGNVVNGATNTEQDMLYGEIGNDTLYGDGYDVLYGGVGDDIYYINGINNHVQEMTGEGFDTVRRYVSFGVGGSPDPQSSNSSPGIEVIELVGTAHISAYGSGDAETLLGNSGNNVLNGRGGHDLLNGGAGNDTLKVTVALDPAVYGDQNVTLIGGAGTDIFAIGASGKLVGANNTVLISDFQHGVDKIMFNTIAGPGTLLTLTTPAGATLDDMLTLATSQMTTSNTISQFVFAGDTYLVMDRSSSNGFASADTAIKVAGVPLITWSDLAFGVVGV